MINANNIRLLNSGEIECRVAQQDKNNAWCMLLLYKDARVDMKILDETFGSGNWKRSHELLGDRLYCTVSIYDEEKQQWVSKQDVGTESNSEKEKGQASDSFKRACFNWGIGRELYTAPKIFVNLRNDDLSGNGYIKTRFYVGAIAYNDNKEITYLVIVDDKGEQRFKYGLPRISEKQLMKLADKIAAGEGEALDMAYQAFTITKEDIDKLNRQVTDIKSKK